ncbi:MAG TPA: hypothetical protein VNT27_13210, partial [Propionibacteriaceae bacterium]|nr:hypothetical protein [Propionibacteriaceae bacterium]
AHPPPGWAARQVPYKIGVLEMQSSQTSSLGTGHPWTKAQVGGHRPGGGNYILDFLLATRNA